MGALYRYLDPREVDAIALSHLHADHCLDLCGYVAALLTERPVAATPVYAPANAAARLVRAYDVAGDDGEAGESGLSIAEHLDWRTWRPSQRIGPFTVQTVRVAHPVEAYGIRVEEDATGAAMVYSGDTGPTEALVQLANNVDLLLVESAFLDGPDNPPGMHLSAQAAAIGQPPESVASC